MPPMRLLWLVSGSILLSFGCDGGSGGPCVIDSDCSDISQVCIDRVCQPVGAVPEAGVSDSGPAQDSGTPPSDSGVVMGDAGSDGGMGEDGGAADGGGMDCPDAAIAAGPTPCAYTATSTAGDPPTPALDGTFVLLSDGSLDMAMSPLSVGGDPAVDCSGNLGGDTLTITCNDGSRTCVMQLQR